MWWGTMVVYATLASVMWYMVGYVVYSGSGVRIEIEGRVENQDYS